MQHKLSAVSGLEYGLLLLHYLQAHSWGGALVVQFVPSPGLMGRSGV